MCCSLAFWFSLKMTALTPISARLGEADWQTKTARCQSLVLWRCVCHLSIICQKGVRNYFAVKSWPRSVWSQLKWNTGLFWHKKRMRIWNHFTSMLCFWLASYLVCVLQVIILAYCWMRRWWSFLSTSWRTRCTGAVLLTTSAWHSCKCYQQLCLSSA